jgi:hypothetical protein|tara:strand:- start:1006 stop:1239 length:234 start_codon:yes stop_codon:yes gene_type:complete
MEHIARKIIEKCGGPGLVASWAGVSLTSVYRWTYSRESGGTGGRIPGRHIEKLITQAGENGIALSTDDFFFDNDAAA